MTIFFINLHSWILSRMCEVCVYPSPGLSAPMSHVDICLFFRGTILIIIINWNGDFPLCIGAHSDTRGQAVNSLYYWIDLQAYMSMPKNIQWTMILWIWNDAIDTDFACIVWINGGELHVKIRHFVMFLFYQMRCSPFHCIFVACCILIMMKYNLFGYLVGDSSANALYLFV